MPTLDHIEAHRLLKKLYPTGEANRAMRCAYTLVRLSRKGVLLSPEEAAEARDAVKVPHSEETKRKISEALTGKPKSDEARKHMSENHPDVNGVNNPFYGKHHKEETKKRWSDQRKGSTHPGYTKGMHWTLEPFTEEHKRNISEACMGRVPWNKGIPRSDETKSKISAKLTGRKAKPWTEERRKKFNATIAMKKASNS